LDERQRAIDLLDEAEGIRVEYVRIANEGGANVSEQLNDYMESYLPRLAEVVMALGNEQSLQAVIAAEHALGLQLNTVAGFWHWLRQNDIVKLGDKEPQQARTKLPPEPSEQITGPAVMAYLTELRAWIIEAAAELWLDDVPFEVPKIGGRYVVGDLNHTAQLVQVFTEGQQLREHWAKVADCGAYWESVPIGSSRARLLFKALELMERILHPLQQSPIMQMFNMM
jgi:hypothetical protein